VSTPTNEYFDGANTTGNQLSTCEADLRRTASALSIDCPP
jgi:hypothetical protein